MSQLIEIYNWFILFVIYLMDLSSELVVFFLFYPIGIYFAILIVFYLIYILTVFKYLIICIYRCFYYVWNLDLIFYEYWNKSFITFFWDLFATLLINNSVYHYVFLLKRFQFLFFLLFIILIFF